MTTKLLLKPPPGADGPPTEAAPPKAPPTNPEAEASAEDSAEASAEAEAEAAGLSVAGASFEGLGGGFGSKVLLTTILENEALLKVRITPDLRTHGTVKRSSPRSLPLFFVCLFVSVWGVARLSPSEEGS